MNRRAFIAGLTATAAGLLIPSKRVWALDRTMLTGTDYWRTLEWDPRWSYPSIETMTVDAGIVGYKKIWAPLDQRDEWTTPDAPHFVVSGDYVYGFQGNSVYRWNGAAWDKQ